MTREEIERDAAAQVGVSGEVVEQRSTEPAEKVVEPETGEQPVAEHADPATPATRPRSDGIRGWFRELVSPEPADVRRQRLEAEAAAQLGLDKQHDQAAGF
jgi:hypothetical protein